MTTDRTPIFVNCGKCQHEWAMGFFPISAEAFGKMKHVRCPLCGSKSIFMGEVPKPTGDGDYMAWLRNGDTGVSSKTIWSVMTGHPVESGSIPWDPSDFGRCYRLLKVMPSWRGRLQLVADRFPMWGPLVGAWEELTALYEYELEHGPMQRGQRMAPRTYARMKELIQVAETAQKGTAPATSARGTSGSSRSVT